jgi:hypothetical protein
MGTTFVSFFTPKYANHAAGLIDSLDARALQHDVTCIGREFESWQAACQFKARFMLDYHQNHVPFVWLDADARLRKYPGLFDQIEHNTEADVAVHHRLGVELLGGTVWMRGNDRSLEVCRRWVELCGVDRQTFDQVLLGRAIKDCGARVHELPPSYCQIFDTMAHHGEPVIEHLQASRSLKH